MSLIFLLICTRDCYLSFIHQAWVLAALLLMQLPAHACGKALKDNPSTWVPTIPVELYRKFLATGFNTALWLPTMSWMEDLLSLALKSTSPL